MKLKIFLTTALCFLIALALGAWAESRLDDQDNRYEKFEEQFEADLGGVDAVKLSIVNGSIGVETWGGNQVKIEMHEKVRVNNYVDAQTLADEIKLIGRREGSRLVIELDYGSIKKEHRKYFSGSVDVKLPARLDLDLNTVKGSVDIDEIEGDLSVDTTNGNINADGCGGDAELETTNGNITAGLIHGRTDAETTNGNITLEGIGGPVEVETTNGSITVDLKEDLRGEVRLETTNGGITLSCGPGSGFELDARTSLGRVHVSDDGSFQGDFDRKHTRVEGTFGGGGHKVYARTTNGSIRINTE